MKLCSISSGSSGNCIYAGTGSASILVDAGISGIRIEKGLNSIELTTKDMDAILVTHEHSDHIKGLGILARRYGIPVYATQGTLSAIEENTSVGKIPQALFHVIHADTPFKIGDMDILPFSISHDAAEPVGFRIGHNNKKAAIATDMGCYNDYIIRHLMGLDVLLLESNHDVRMLEAGRYPYYLKKRILGEKGHLSNEDCGRLLSRVLHDGMKQVYLGHLSKENNYEELAYETVCSEVTMGDNPYNSKDFCISIAHRDVASAPVIF
ncbi:MAG TPA: MBL fold metallo-hydrolase [Lachnospiraceae bacterium]|nr:MBL fold metallo-hydrolase [Lachnospiraceae bacterium]